MKNQTKILSESIADQLLLMIGTDRQYQPGEKLPNENDLSAMLGVSRSTLREAIRMLSAGGVLEIRRGLGTYVTSQTSLDYAGLKTLTTAAKNVYDAFELRLMFEPKCARLAVERATDQELRSIVQRGNELIELLEKGAPSVEADKQFHESIATAAHNEFIQQLLPVIYEGIQNSIPLMQQNPQFFASTIKDTQTIIDFIGDRNPEGASAAMELHILQAMRYLDALKHDTKD
jgi:DNA-binding FadR family transcriptional regulator